MNFQEFVIPSMTQEDIVPQSTCFESSIQHELSSESDESLNQKKPTVTRFIRKKYDPIVSDNKTIRYEDDPIQYKKARKKIQNRISAVKIRGKKKTELELLQTEVQQLKQKNCQLSLINSKLQGQNAILKQKSVLLQKMLFKQQQDKISSYITSQNNSKNSSSSPYRQSHSDDFNSPFEQDTWFRSPNSPIFGRSSAYILVMTVILAIVIAPSSSSESSAIIATKISQIQVNAEVNELITRLYQNTLLIERLKHWGKILFVIIYLVIFSLFAYKKKDLFLKRKKVM